MAEDTLPAVDRRAIKVLFDTYWTPRGWRDETARSTSAENLKYAKQAGVMFDPVWLTHDDIIKRALAAVRDVEREAVANAFVVSLASRRLELRSALGSFAVLQHFPHHAAPRGRSACPVCGEYQHAVEEEDLSVLNFERFKWGGVRHDQPVYASLDLELFRKLPRINPTPADMGIFKGLLKAIKSVPATTSSSALQRPLGQSFKSSKAERETLIGILGYCGILATIDHPGYTHRFVHESDRRLPARRFVDMAYPACWWQRTDGLNEDALAYWFGHVL